MSWVYFNLFDKSTYPKNNEPIIAAYNDYCGEKIVTVGVIDKVNNRIKLQINGEIVTYKLSGLAAWCSLPDYPAELNGVDSRLNVQTICMGRTRMWATREEALAFFEQALNYSEGNTKLRYLNVYMDLKNGLTVCRDVED